MLILQLAYRNIIGAGLRTWLNVIVLSLAFVLIILGQGMMAGMTIQIKSRMIESELGGGQIRQKNYDPFDPLSLEDSHAVIPPAYRQLIDKQQATPILVRPGSIYPGGRIQSAIFKGIDPRQTIINLPSEKLSGTYDTIPAFIGARMAKAAGLKKGDNLTVRWRDVNGTFDAQEVTIVHIMHTDVPSVDNGQLWVPLASLQQMVATKNHATILVLKPDQPFPNGKEEDWVFHDLDMLLKDINDMMKQKQGGSNFFYLILFAMGLLAIFDTQVLSLFKRRKEMGTLMALGMDRVNVIQLFTLEGSLHGVLAFAVGAIYGVPLMIYTTVTGIKLPDATDDFGIAIGTSIYTSFGLPVLLGTTLLLLLTVVVVSYLPTRKISKLKPTDAIRGRLS